MKSLVKTFAIAAVISSMVLVGGCGKKATPAPERPKTHQGVKQNKGTVKKDVNKGKKVIKKDMNKGKDTLKKDMNKGTSSNKSTKGSK